MNDDAMVTTRRATSRSVPLTVALSVLSLTACAPQGEPRGEPTSEVVCTAIGYSSTLTVQLSGDTEAVKDIQLCQDGNCSPGGEDDPDPAGLDVYGPALELENAGGWVFAMFSTPDEVYVRTYDRDGNVLTDTLEQLEWVPLEDTGECPGPVGADVTVTV